MKTFLGFVMMATFLLSANAADGLTEKLQRGLFEEEANHNLDAAIKEYQSVVSQAEEQRKVMATALFRLGECYRKLGRTNEANAQYERVVRDFSEQEQLVKLSRSLLPLQNTEARRPPAGVGEDHASVKLLREEIALAEQQVRVTQSKTDAGRGTLDELLRVKQDVLRLKRMLPENTSPTQQKALLEEQIGIVQKLLNEVQRRVEVGVVAPGEDVSLKREVLALQRELSVVSDVGTSLPGGETAATDEEEKEVRRIQAMIKDSPDLINARENDGNTPLHRATQLGQIVVTRFLIASKADVNARNSISGETPLHFAARQGHKSLVELLIENGASVNTASLKDADTPLHLAVEKGFRAVIEVLLARKADINAKGGRGETPLHRAVVKGFKSITELLLAQGADVNAKTTEDNTPLHLAARIGHRDLVELLLTKGAAIDAITNFKTTPLHYAVQIKSLPIVELLLEKKANPNLADASGTTPLSRAVQEGPTNLLGLLLANGADPNIGNHNAITPLHWAAMMNGGEEMAELLLKNKASISAKVSWAPGAPPPQSKGRATIPNGATPLGLAVGYGQVRTAELLLDHGAEVETLADAKDGGGTLLPPLEVAIKGGPALVKLLLERNANPNRTLSDGRTPLMRTAQLGNKEIVELLLAHGAEVNVLSPGGWNPLAVAVSYSKPEIAELLRQHGAIEDLARSSSITVARGTTRQSMFEKGTNNFNQFTLFEALAQHYGVGKNPFSFPDFTRVQVRSIKSKASEPGKTVDLETAFQFTNCAVNTWLEWGDLIELPEQDHLAMTPWGGLSTSAKRTLRQCLRKQVSIVVKGQTNRVVLIPALAESGYGGVTIRLGSDDGSSSNPATSSSSDPKGAAEIELTAQRLNDVVRGANVIRSSSDLARVKVTRVGAAPTDKQEMVFDLVHVDKTSDLWLRDGDVIEIPEKK